MQLFGNDKSQVKAILPNMIFSVPQDFVPDWNVLKQFTGVSDPYEVPVAPEIAINTANVGPDEVIEVLMKKIKLLGYVQ